jgi:hypothetical protein
MRAGLVIAVQPYLCGVLEPALVFVLVCSGPAGLRQPTTKDIRSHGGWDLRRGHLSKR